MICQWHYLQRRSKKGQCVLRTGSTECPGQFQRPHLLRARVAEMPQKSSSRKFDEPDSGRISGCSETFANRGAFLWLGLPIETSPCAMDHCVFSARRQNQLNPFFNPTSRCVTRVCRSLGGSLRWRKLLGGLNRWALTR